MLSRLLIASLALIGLTAFTLAAPAPKYRPPAVAEQLKKLQGMWELSTTVTVPQAVAGGAVAQRVILNRVSRSTTRIRIDGDKWSYVRNLNGEERVTTAYTMKLDTSKKPMWLDLVRDGTNMPTMQGILAIEGDTLKFCYSTATRVPRLMRPTAVTSGEGYNVLTLKRIAMP
jgi:uncharacterized protein (TIGR03067 family)